MSVVVPGDLEQGGQVPGHQQLNGGQGSADCVTGHGGQGDFHQATGVRPGVPQAGDLTGRVCRDGREEPRGGVRVTEGGENGLEEVSREDLL